jgi:uncharacterized membrane protein
MAMGQNAGVSPHARAHLDAQEEWEQADDDVSTGSDTPEMNVGTSERLASVLGGSLLTIVGLRRRSNFGALLAIVGGGLIYRGLTGHCRVYEMLGRNTAVPPEPREYFEHGVHVEESVTIDKPAAELYRFWRNFENLPSFMEHLECVKETDDRCSHWVAKAPAGGHVEWDAEIINEEPNRTIAWRSIDGSDVHSAGSVRFLDAADGRGTEVRVTLEYLPPAGEAGRWVAKLFGEEPQQQVRDDLCHFKEHMEARASTTTYA